MERKRNCFVLYFMDVFLVILLQIQMPKSIVHTFRCQHTRLLTLVQELACARRPGGVTSWTAAAESCHHRKLEAARNHRQAPIACSGRETEG